MLDKNSFITKLSSRKYHVWIVWTLLTIALLYLNKNISPEWISWYGFVSVAYIGGNAISVLKKKE